MQYQSIRNDIMNESVNEDDSRIEGAPLSKEFLLNFCSFLSNCTSISISLVLFTNLFSLLYISDKNFIVFSLCRLIIRLYNIIFCCIAFLSEMELTETVRNINLFHSWSAKGLILIFIAVLTIDGFSYIEKPNLSYLMILTKFSTSSLIFFGIIYTILVKYYYNNYYKNNYNKIIINEGFHVFEEN